MELKNYNVYFFFIILIAVSAVTFFIFQPFLVAILVAAVLSVIFRPTYNFFLGKFNKRKRLSAFITSFIAMLLIVVPFSIIFALIVNEITTIYQDISAGGVFRDSYISPIIRYIENNKLLTLLGADSLINKDSISSSLSQFGQLSFNFVQVVYQSLAHFIFMTFVLFFSLYYFLVNGREVASKIMMLSPLRDTHEKMLLEKFVSMSRATIKGTIVVSFVQGLIGGLTFAIAGVPSAMIWAVVMMLLSLIPMFGSSIIWFPVGVGMLLLGNIWQGLFILIVGLLIISLIDNFLRPELVGKDTQMHPLIVLFATLGGISVFGFLGFIIGPIIVALFLSLWDIYGIEFKKQLRSFNS